MDRTTAHELAEEFAGYTNENADIRNIQDDSESVYQVELTPDIVVIVHGDGSCDYA